MRRRRSPGQCAGHQYADTGKVIFGEGGGTLQLDQPPPSPHCGGLRNEDGIDLPGIGFGATTTLAFSRTTAAPAAR